MRSGLFVLGGLIATGFSCAAAAGPDVVVSEIGFGSGGIDKYGTLNGVTGYAVATTACNIGNAPAIWIDYSNEHPVIGSQMYRLRDGHFEMIGLSWLKHSFFAADAPGCLHLAPGGTYQPHASGQWLGLFASDTYSAFLNGQQVNLGPRSEVNAATGNFAFPPLNGWGNRFNCLRKRLQAANADLDPALNPGARYFIESVYVPSDETAAVRSNNASYREVIVGGLTMGSRDDDPANTTDPCVRADLGRELAFIGPTVPMKPAIEAWKAIDPAVVIVYADIAGDGRVAVAARARPAPGGTWEYQYVVYNHNSDRSIGSFSIPKASSPAVAISHLDFHDVAYHSGEPWDGADWPAAVNSGSVDWATTSHASNPAANAIRWSTAYTFRFRATGSPAPGNVTLGLFKPGTPASTVLAGVPVPMTPLCPADFNGIGGVTVQDIFDYLNAYFGGDPLAEFNGAGGISVQDLFDYLGAYFTPCP